MKIHEYNEMMSYLTRPAQPKNIKVADLVDDLTPGPLKDELTKDFDPSQETHEQYLQRKALEDDRVRLAIGGGAIEGEDLGTREGFAGPQLVKTGDKKGQYKVRYRDSKFGKRDKGTGYKEGNEFFKTKKEADAFYKKLKSETAAKKTAGFDIKNTALKNHAQQINNFVNDFIDQNIENYGVRDYQKFEKDLKKAFKKSGIKDVSGRKSLYADLPNIGTSESEAPFTSKYESKPLVKGTTATGTNNKNYFKNLFYSGKIATDKTLQNRIGNYLDYYNTDKSFRTNPNVNRKALLLKYDDALSNLGDVMYMLGDDEVGTGKFRSGVIKKFFPEKVELFNRKKSISNALYNEKLAQIEKKLSTEQLERVLDGETSIKNFMAKQTDKLKEIFDVSNLDEGLKFSLDHTEGIAEIAKMNNKKDIMRGLQNLIGTTQARNYELGWRGYSTQRKNLTNLINQGVNVEDNLKELNKITKAAYPETKGKDAYKFVNNKITPTKNFRFLFNPQKAFQQYFTEIAGTEKGLKELQTQSFKNPQLRKIIESDPNLKKLVADKFADQRGFITPELLGADKLAKAAKLYGPQAARLANMSLIGGLGSGGAELLLLDASQKAGLSPQEIVLNMATAGVGTSFKDIQEKADFVRQKGFGNALESAFRKQQISQNVRPAPGLPSAFGAPQELTPSEKEALRIFNEDAAKPIEERRALQAAEYERQDQTDFSDPMFRETFDKGGPSDPSKRKFIKVMGGLASIPFVGKFFKAAEPVAPAVVEGAKSVPPYFFKLIDKIKEMGQDVTKRFATKDRENIYNYRTADADYELYEDLDTGSVQIKIRKGDPDGSGGYKEQELTLTKGQADEQTGFVPDEYDEYTVRPDGDGKLKDVEEGLEDIDDLIEEIGPENISVKELQDMGYDVDRLGPVTKKKLGIK